MNIQGDSVAAQSIYHIGNEIKQMAERSSICEFSDDADNWGSYIIYRMDGGILCNS